MGDIIYLDKDGTETLRQKKGRGRPPRGAQRQGDDFVVPYQPPKEPTKYLTINQVGEIIEEEVKSRGRACKGFKRQTKDPHKGHWVKVVKTVATTSA